MIAVDPAHAMVAAFDSLHRFRGSPVWMTAGPQDTVMTRVCGIAVEWVLETTFASGRQFVGPVKLWILAPESRRAWRRYWAVGQRCLAEGIELKIGPPPGEVI